MTACTGPVALGVSLLLLLAVSCQAGSACSEVGLPLAETIRTRQLPVVLWHGMGDSCCNNRSIGAVRRRIQEVLGGVFVHSIATGEGGPADSESTIFGNVNAQVEDVCRTLAGFPELKDGYNAVGFSQGGQFMRAVVERCQHTGPKVHTLVTLGGQHQGVMNVPKCWNPSFNVTPSYMCSLSQRFLGWGSTLPLIRTHLVQAQYFKEPRNIASYKAHNIFLADINNDRDTKNTLYKDNLSTLEKFVMFRFQHDTTVVPRDSAWFAWYNGTQLLTMNQTALYQEDWIGMRTLHEAGKLEFGECPGDHMHFNLEWFEDNIVEPYLRAPAETIPRHS